MPARRPALIVLLSLSLLAGAAGGPPGSSGVPPSAPAASAAKPNVVLFLTDDQRFDQIGRCATGAGGFDGSDLGTSDQDVAVACMPNVKRLLMRTGVVFTRGAATTALCCPSRSSILTGRYARHTGVMKNGGAFAAFEDGSTIATWLDGAGYRTGLFGKYFNGYGSKSTPAGYVPPGWDSWHAFWNGERYVDYSLLEKDPGTSAVVRSFSGTGTSSAACAAKNNYSTDLLCQRALTFLRRDTTAPFFLYLAFNAPHSEFRPPQRYGDPGVVPPTYPSFNTVPTGREPSDTPAWLPTQPLGASTVRDLRTSFRKQLRTLRAVDDAVGAVWNELATEGRLSNTVFLFMSDNGISLGEYRLYGKACVYQTCHGVPYLIACPAAVCGASAPRGVNRTTIALNIDLAPTIAALAGVTPATPVDGISLVPVLQGATPAPRDRFVLEDWGTSRILNEDHSLVEDRADGHTYLYVELPLSDQRELYDLTTDPYALENLWHEPAYQATLAAMAADLQAELAR